MKKLLYIVLALFIGIVLLLTALFVVSFYGDAKREEIIQANLKEINACINRKKQKPQKEDDFFKKDDYEIREECTDDFLFLYENTRKGIDYNTLAEKVKYRYVAYTGVDNKTLIEKLIKAYPSIKDKITGLEPEEKNKK